MSNNTLKTECERCGTCCMKGGPALHIEDKKLLQQKFIARESLITIRKGEPVFALEENRLELAKTEFVKLKGNKNEWSCVFYNRNNSSCSIYDHRPLECLLLKCWDTEELEAIAGRNLLSRLDIISSHEHVTEYIKRQEHDCSLGILDQLMINRNKDMHKSTLAELTELVNIDLALRSEALRHLSLSLDLELFYLGRPLFKILSQFALIPKEINGKIILIQA